ncbi:hypothetical protein ACN24L_06770 [Streptomyces microflavus]
MWWAAPGDRALRGCEDAFLLGDALLVAPVMESGAERRVVRLPRGRWYDTVTGRAYEGPGPVVVDAPLSRIPVLARAGRSFPCGTRTVSWSLRCGRPRRGVPGRAGGPGPG